MYKWYSVLVTPSSSREYTRAILCQLYFSQSALIASTSKNADWIRYVEEANGSWKAGNEAAGADSETGTKIGVYMVFAPQLRQVEILSAGKDSKICVSKFDFVRKVMWRCHRAKSAFFGFAEIRTKNWLSSKKWLRDCTNSRHRSELVSALLRLQVTRKWDNFLARCFHNQLQHWVHVTAASKMIWWRRNCGVAFR